MPLITKRLIRNRAKAFITSRISKLEHRPPNSRRAMRKPSQIALLLPWRADRIPRIPIVASIRTLLQLLSTTYRQINKRSPPIPLMHHQQHRDSARHAADHVSSLLENISSRRRIRAASGHGSPTPRRRDVRRSVSTNTQLPPVRCKKPTGRTEEAPPRAQTHGSPHPPRSCERSVRD